MLPRIGRIVVDVKTHTALARELSLGLFEALSVLARGHASFGSALSDHDATVRPALPGF